jgi:hypothetical protein
MNYAPKANGFNVRGVGAFFDTCSNLGQLSNSNTILKHCMFISPKSKSKKNYALMISYRTFWGNFDNLLEILVVVGLWISFLPPIGGVWNIVNACVRSGRGPGWITSGTYCGYTKLCTIRLPLLGLLSHPLQIKDSKLTLMSYNFARGPVLNLVLECSTQKWFLADALSF